MLHIVFYLYLDVCIFNTNQWPKSYIFQIHNELRHFSKSLLPVVYKGMFVVYVQHYIINTDETTKLILQKIHECLQPIMVELQNIFKNHNIFYVHYKQTYKNLKNIRLYHRALVPNFVAHLYFKARINRRHCNLPYSGEFVVRILGDQDVPNNICDVVLHFRGNTMYS